jgi:hypothetical protein
VQATTGAGTAAVFLIEETGLLGAARARLGAGPVVGEVTAAARAFGSAVARA